METSPFIIKKIPLKDFITILIDLYNRGADFVDLTGRPDGQEDLIQLSIIQEYITEEENNITEEDLNNLIG